MNSCVPREVLSALADGECGPEERRYAHAHLQECDDCLRAAQAFTSVQGLVGALPRIVAPETFVAAVLAPPAAPRRMVQAAFRGRRRWVAGAVAAAALGVSLAGLAAPPNDDPAPVDVFVNRHVSVNDGSSTGGQVLFAVPGR